MGTARSGPQARRVRDAPSTAEGAVPEPGTPCAQHGRRSGGSSVPLAAGYLPRPRHPRPRSANAAALSGGIISVKDKNQIPSEKRRSG